MPIDVTLINELMSCKMTFEDAFTLAQGKLSENARELYSKAVEKRALKKTLSKCESSDDTISFGESLFDTQSSHQFNDEDDDDFQLDSINKKTDQARSEILRDFEQFFGEFVSVYQRNHYKWNRADFFDGFVVKKLNETSHIPHVFNVELDILVNFFSDILTIPEYNQYMFAESCAEILLWLMEQALLPGVSVTIRNRIIELGRVYIIEKKPSNEVLRLRNQMEENTVKQLVIKYLSLFPYENDVNKCINLLMKNKFFVQDDILQLKKNHPHFFHEELFSLYFHKSAREKSNLDAFVSRLDVLLNISLTPEIELQKIIHHIVVERKDRNLDSKSELDAVLQKYTDLYKSRYKIPEEILELLNKAQWSSAREYFNSQQFIAFSRIFLERSRHLPIQFHKLGWSELYRIGEFMFGDKPELITNKLLEADFPLDLFFVNKKTFSLLMQNTYLFSMLMVPCKVSQDFSELESHISDHSNSYNRYTQNRKCFYQEHGHDHFFLSFHSWEKLKKMDDRAQDASLSQTPKIPRRLRFFLNLSLSDSLSKPALEHGIPRISQ